MKDRIQISRYDGSNTDPDRLGYRDDIASGRVAFAHLIRLWHARNGWSHRVLPALADALDLGRVHNSQLSMLRNGKLASPGPEVFFALGGINRWLAEALETSAQPVRAADGSVLGAGDLLEVFVGLRQPPPAFDLRIEEEEAADLSAALALLLTAGRPWRLCREQLMAAYPASRRQRRERFAEVMAGQSDYSASELDSELPDLRSTLAALGVAGEAELSGERFLELLRRRARRIRGEVPGNEPQDLAAAIRRELGGVA